MTASVRTIYVEVVDKKSGEPVKGVRLRRLAATVVAEMPRAWKPRYGDDAYIRAGTRFLEPAPEGGPWPPARPVIKIRGEGEMRNWALAAVARYVKVDRVTGYDRQLIGGKR